MADNRGKSQRFVSPPNSARAETYHQKPRLLRTFSPAVKLRQSQGLLHEPVPEKAPVPMTNPDEIRLLRTQLSGANKEIRELKDRYQQDISQLRLEMQSLRSELDLLRFERDEAQTKMPESDRDFTHLARQIISMRTEIDKLSSSFWRFQRENAISQNLEQLLKGRIHMNGKQQG